MRDWKPKLGVCLVVLSLLAGCGGSGIKAPIGTRGEPDRRNVGYHVVRPGESLYSIAWQYGLDYQSLAKWNAIDPPYTIYAGQQLQLTPSHTSYRKSQQYPEKTEDKDVKIEITPATPAVPPKPDRYAYSGPVRHWRWPATGSIVRPFDANSPGKKGIGIAGNRGTRIHAAADGRVVYSGSGLIGYGRLIIIKHNNNFLSAYGYNEKLLVKEGQRVTAGQVIAYMGSSGTNRTMLHFEIRKDGKPVDPLRYLPKRR